jgi:TetR/AcrR family transcriptional repressor of nem operon
VRRRKALTAMAALVGALMLARAVEGDPLSEEMLDAVHHELLAVAES